MTWVAWRQQRLQVLVSTGLIAAVAAVMTWVRLDASSLAHDRALLVDRYGEYVSYQRMAMLVLPLLIGVFAGAPLFAREIENGTHVFGLTQSIGRSRWWATKLAVAGVPVVLGMTLLGLVSTWSQQALAAFNFNGRMVTPVFEGQGVVLGVYTALAFTVGATLGLVVRNTLASMVLTIAAYVPLLALVASALRPSYAGPLSAPLSQLPEDAWRVETDFVDAAGNPVDLSPAQCAGRMDACIAEQGVVPQVRFHPDERFWSFQAIESGLLLGVSAVALAVGAWALHRRLRLG